MHRKFFLKFIQNFLMAAASLVFLTGLQTLGAGGVARAQGPETQGSLRSMRPGSPKPFAH